MGEIVEPSGSVSESWSQVVALILRDMDPEARLEFMRVLGVWKRLSTHTIQKNSAADATCYEGDLMRAESRMVKLQALEERLQRELELTDAELSEGFVWEYREAEDGGGSITVGPDGKQRGQTILSTRSRRAVGPWQVARERTVI